MAIASSNFTILRYGEYADPTDLSTAPTTIREIPMTGESLTWQTQSISSQNINSSRQILDTVQTGYEVSGGINIEFAPVVWDHLMQGVMWGNWQGTAVELDDVAVSITKATRTIEFTGAEAPFETTDVAPASQDGIKAGQFFKLIASASGSIDADNCGVFQVETVSDASTAVVKAVDGATPFAGGDDTGNCKVRASMLRAPADGSSTNMKKHIFAFEKEQSDLDTPTFTKFTGCRMNTWSLNAQSASLITGSFDMMGTTSAIATSSIGTTAKKSSFSFNGLNAVSHVDDIIVNGENYNGSSNQQYIQGLDFSVTNNLRGIKAIGQVANVEIGTGMLGITGNLNVFFSTTDLYTLFTNQTEFPLSYSVFDENGNGYVFFFPRCVISSDSMSSGGQDQDINLHAD